MLSWDAMMAPSESHCVFHGEARHFQSSQYVEHRRVKHVVAGDDVCNAQWSMIANSNHTRHRNRAGVAYAYKPSTNLALTLHGSEFSKTVGAPDSTTPTSTSVNAMPFPTLCPGPSSQIPSLRIAQQVVVGDLRRVVLQQQVLRW